MGTQFGIEIAGKAFFRITQADKSKLFNWHTLAEVKRTIKGQERTEKVSGPTFDTAEECVEHALGFAEKLGVALEGVRKVVLPETNRAAIFQKRERDPELVAMAKEICAQAPAPVGQPAADQPVFAAEAPKAKATASKAKAAK